MKTKKISVIRETSILLLFRREKGSTMTFYNENAYAHSPWQIKASAYEI